jgi:hypothetical protein
MLLRKELPAGFVVPAQPVERTTAPSGVGWVHEIKHDGYRMIVRRDDTLPSNAASLWISCVSRRIGGRRLQVNGRAGSERI